MRIALTHFMPYRVFDYVRTEEPANLLGMLGLLRRAKIEARTFPGAKVDREILLRQLLDYHPDIVGLSAISNDQENYEPWREFCADLKRAGIMTILGGMGPTTDPHGFARDLAPDILVRGEGELVMEQFIKAGFLLDRMEQLPIFQERLDQTLIFGFDPVNPPRVELDALDYLRDYDLSEYNFHGWPYLQIGCPHGCIFCPGDKKIRYKSPQAALREIGYLIDVLGAKVINSLGSDYTAGPKHALAIIEALIEEQYASQAGYRFIVRLDTLDASRDYGRQPWDKFASQTEFLTFNTGIESFSPARRLRLGKDFSEAQAKEFTAKVDRCLEWADQHPNVDIETNLIVMDPWSTLEEVEEDLIQTELRIKKYPRAFQLVPGALYNVLQPKIGTKSDELFPGGLEGYAQLPGRRSLLLFYYLVAAEKRDYGIFKDKEIKLSEQNLLLINKLRRLIAALKKIKTDDLASLCQRVLQEVIVEGKLDIYDEMAA